MLLPPKNLWSQVLRENVLRHLAPREPEAKLRKTSPSTHSNVLQEGGEELAHTQPHPILSALTLDMT